MKKDGAKCRKIFLKNQFSRRPKRKIGLREEEKREHLKHIDKNMESVEN